MDAARLASVRTSVISAGVASASGATLQPAVSQSQLSSQGDQLEQENDEDAPSCVSMSNEDGSSSIQRRANVEMFVY